MKVPSAKPYFPETDIDEILSEFRVVLTTGALTMGPRTEDLEQRFAQYVGTQYAVAVSSGTSALEIALRYFDVRGAEVIVPTNTFIASANTVIFSGGTPVLCDIREDTLCLDPGDVLSRITPRTKGVMVVHIAGLPCPQMDQLQELCKRSKLFLLEDAAHAPGAEYRGVKVGGLGDAACFSFFATKPMTTAEGGMITTNDSRLYQFARSVRNHAREPGDIFRQLGNNWRMSELNAVLGLHQITRMDEIIDKRSHIAQRYDRALKGLDGLSILPCPEDLRHSYYKYVVLLKDQKSVVGLKARLMSEHGIETGVVYYPPVHLQPYYQQEYGYGEGMLPVAESVLARHFCLPIYTEMNDDIVDYVVKAVKLELAAL